MMISCQIKAVWTCKNCRVFYLKNRPILFVSVVIIVAQFLLSGVSLVKAVYKAWFIMLCLWLTRRKLIFLLRYDFCSHSESLQTHVANLCVLMYISNLWLILFLILTVYNFSSDRWKLRLLRLRKPSMGQRLLLPPLVLPQLLQHLNLQLLASLEYSFLMTSSKRVSRRKSAPRYTELYAQSHNQADKVLRQSIVL